MEGLLAWRWLPWLLIGFGASIRVAQYLANRALWIDEAFLALNITRRPLDQLLFQPLDFAQAAPPGFLLLQWLAVQALGTSEFALRLVPLLASLAALPLFYMVARQLLPPVGMLVALALFALLEPLVYYASEVKQYSSDMALVLLIYVVVLGVQERGLNWRNGLALALVGALAMWCSHPVLFVLGGVGLSLALLALLARQWRQLAGLAAIGLAWAVSLAALYVISLQPIRANSVLNSFWNDRFMPLPPRSMADILWFVDAFFQPFQNPAGFQNHAAGVAIACFLIGAGALALKRSPWLLFLVTPNLLALLASGLHLYPYAYRLLLFSVPAMLLLIGTGIGALYDYVNKKTLVLLPVVFLLLFWPVLSAFNHLLKPRTNQEITQALAYVQQRQQPGDVLYLYFASEYAFDYYRQRFPGLPARIVVGVDSGGKPAVYERDLGQLRGNARVWLLFTHTRKADNYDEELFFLNYLDRIGKREDAATFPGASVYRYDLRR